MLLNVIRELAIRLLHYMTMLGYLIITIEIIKHSALETQGQLNNTNL